MARWVALRGRRFDNIYDSVINTRIVVHGATLLNRFQFSAILIFFALVWGLVLWVSGVELSWVHAQPYGVTAFIVTTLIVLFDKYLWHWPIFRGWLTTIPYIGGEWDVALLSSYVDPDTGRGVDPILGTMTVSQTLTTLIVRLSTSKQHSHTLAYDIREVGGESYVMGVYQSDPSFENRAKSPIHYGTFKLRLERTPRERLVGHYWTDRNTSGNFEAINRRSRLRRTKDEVPRNTEPRKG